MQNLLIFSKYFPRVFVKYWFSPPGQKFWNRPGTEPTKSSKILDNALSAFKEFYLKILKKLINN